MQQMIRREAPGGAMSWLPYGCVALFMVPFLVAGVSITIGALREGTFAGDVVIRLVMGLVFSGVAIAIMAGVWFAMRSTAAAMALKQQYPEQPWMWRDDWARGVVRDQTKGATIVLTIFALIWNGVSWPAAYAMRNAVREEKLLLIFVILFPLVGLLVAYAAIHKALQARKFGVSLCRPERIPIQPGRTFRGEIEARVGERPENGFKMRLTCVNRITTRGGRNSSTTERTLWMEEIVVPAAAAAPGPNGMHVPFAIPIARDVQPTDATDTYNQTLWRLGVTAELPGVDYEASFEVPVYETGEPLPDVVEPMRFASSSVSTSTSWTPSAASGITLGTTLDGKEEMRIAPSRDLGALFGLVVFTTIWIGAIVLMVRFAVPIAIPIIFGFFALLMLFAIVDAVAGRARIVIDPAAVNIRYTWFGMGLTRVIEAAKVQGIIVTPSKKRFNVEVRLRDGTTAPVARNVREKSDADALVARMVHALKG